MLCTRIPGSKDSLASHLIPLASAHQLTMHALLALGGTHMNFKDEAPLVIRTTTSLHYGAVLRGMQDELRTLSRSKLWQIALVMVVLCHIETIAGSPSGSTFPHLQALRHLIVLDTTLSLQPLSTSEKTVQGLVLEAYAYLAIVSNIMPYGFMKERLIPLDPFVVSLSHLEEFETYGTFFSCGHDIFECILPISQYASRVLAEEMLAERSRESQAFHRTWLGKLTNWQPEAPIPAMRAWQRECFSVQQMYRHALFIFLECANCGSMVSSMLVSAKLELHVEEVISRVEEVSTSPYGTIMVWPVLIAASCFATEQQRSYLRRRWTNPSRWRMSQLVTAINLLDLMWIDTDWRAFGPYGLYLTMKKHGINLSMA